MRSSRIFLVAQYEESNVELWHRRLGRLNHQNIRTLESLGLVQGLPPQLKGVHEVCETCVKSKQAKSRFNKKKEISTKRTLGL